MLEFKNLARGVRTVPSDSLCVPLAGRIATVRHSPYCDTLRALSRYAHHWMTRAHAVGEESLTDWLLFELSEKIPQVRYVKFTRFDEARSTGADWDWWFVGRDVSMAWRIQAKKLVAGADHYGDLARANRFGLQSEKLLESSGSANLLAFYALYHAAQGKQKLMCGGMSDLSVDEGIFLTAARTTYDNFVKGGRKRVDASDVIGISNPLSCVFCCPLIMDGPRPPVQGIYSYVQHYYPDAVGQTTNSNIHPGLHNHVPAHINALLQLGNERTPDWPETEFGDIAQQTGGLLVFDLREEG